MLEDGSYDVFIVDATPLDGDRGGFRLELTVVAGPHKSEVVALDAAGLAGEDFELIGMPGTLTVADGAPSFRVDR